MSDEHFSIDGTLLQDWASHKSLRPKDEPPPGDGGKRNEPADFRGQARKNNTHASTSDPDARLYRKGNTDAQLSYQGLVLRENRNGLVRDATLTIVQALPGQRRRILGRDKGYDSVAFVANCRAAGVTPHVAQNTSNRRSAIDGCTTRHGGYAVSLKIRAWIEMHFGWLKSSAGESYLRKLRC